MKKVFAILLFVLPFVAFSQSFVFCPEIETDAKQGFRDTKVYLVFDDIRVFEKKKKEKCKKATILAEFANCIKRTYPNMQLVVLDEKQFYEDPVKGFITIKIKLRQFDATFNFGMYRATTTYDVKICDYRVDETVIDETITGDASRFNTVGFVSGKTASNHSFKEAFDKLVLLLDRIPTNEAVKKTAPQSTVQKTTGPRTKAERLRELKQLLDEKILTQEEYDREKKKILDEKE